ncbi:MAG: DHH family phosphoesterase [Archaeoglobi archaeon]|nr:DHH family phosphoesterase [Archaeoglobi archaeon]
MQLIVHHWDADGICSASLIAKHLANGECTNISPPIGEFRFDERVWKAIGSSESVFVADLNVPGELERMDRETTFFDHHIQPRIQNRLIRQINPAINGEKAPSCAFVISRHINWWGVESVIGTVGDVGREAFSIPEIRKSMEKLGMSEEDAVKIVALIDTNHISGNREGVEKAVRVVGELEWRELISFELWIRQSERTEEEFRSVISGVSSKGKRAFVEFKSDFNIISRVARHLVWEVGYDEALVINRDFGGRVQLYYRVSKKISREKNLANLISKLRSAGINAGGKDEVVGCVFSPDKWDVVREIVQDHLGWFG